MNQELNYLLTAQRRNLLDKAGVDRLNRMLRGKEGEDEFALWMEKYAPNLPYFRNVLIKRYNSCEIDYLIPSIYHWVHVEVKFYNYDFYVKDGYAYNPYGKLSDNPLDRAKRTKNILEGVASDFNSPAKVITLMVFINEHGKVHVEGNYDLEIIQRHELLNRLISLNQEIGSDLYSQRELDELKVALDQYSYVPPVQTYELCHENERKE